MCRLTKDHYSSSFHTAVDNRDSNEMQLAISMSKAGSIVTADSCPSIRNRMDAKLGPPSI